MNAFLFAVEWLYANNPGRSEGSYIKGRTEMPKRKKAVEVKTKNPLTNGAFDETAAKDAMKLIKDKKIQIVDLKFNDLPGLWQHFSIPAAELTEMDDITRS